MKRLQRVAVALAFVAESACSATAYLGRTFLNVSQQQYDALVELPILSPVPFTGAFQSGWTARISAELATDIINSQQLILPGFRLNTSWFDDRCDPIHNLKIFVEKVEDGTPWVAMGGNGCSAVCTLAGVVAPRLRLPYISYGCAAAALSDTAIYPDFGRMQPDESLFTAVYQTLVREYGWTRLFIVSSDTARWNGPSQDIVNFFKADTESHVEVQWLSPRAPSWSELLVMMKHVKNTLQRVIVVHGYEFFQRQVMCAAYTVGMPKGAVWIVVGWLRDLWWSTPDSALLAQNPNCTPDILTQYATGAISVDKLNAPMPAEMDRQLDCMPGWTARQFRSLILDHFFKGYPVGQNQLVLPPYLSLLGSGADGVCMWAFTLRHMLVGRGYKVSQIARPTPAVYKEMRDFYKDQLSFFGVMGQFKFAGSNLPGVYSVSQIQHGQKVVVATLDLAGKGEFVLTAGSSLFWGDGSTQPATLFPACPHGYRRLPSGECEACKPSTYEDEQVHDCLPCPAGRFSRETAATTCRRCPVGHVSNSTGSTACTQCPPGSFAEPSADEPIACTQCPPGTHQRTAGVSACTRCELGRFEDQPGAVDCSVCPEGRSTRFLAALSVQDCVCPTGTVHRPGLGCVGCPEGLVCPGDEHPPEQDAGFWAQVVDADSRTYSVYRCRSRLECPAGPAGSCPDGREGIACARCRPGHHPGGSQGRCLACSASGRLTPYLVGGALVLLAAVASIALFGQGAGTSSSMLTVTIILGQVAAAVQTLGTFQQFQIGWVEPLGTILRGIGLLTFDFDVIRVACAMPRDDPVSRLVLQLLAFPAALIALALAFKVATFLSRRCPRLLRVSDGNVGVDHLMNAAGMLALAAFIPLTLTSCDPMRCLRNPNGLMTMAKNPSVICWTSREHQTMAALSVIGLIMYPLLIIALVARATVLHETWLETGQGLSKLRAHRFLFERFTPARYRFGMFYLLRNAVVSVIPTAFVGMPMLQVLTTIIAFLISLVVQVRWWPWRTNYANYTDMLVNIALTFFLAAAAFLLEVPLDTVERTLQVLLMGALALVAAALIAGLSIALRGRFCAKRPYAMFLCHHKAGAGVLCRYIKMVVQRAAKVGVFLDSDQLEDLQNIVEAVRSWTDNLVVVLTKDLLKRIWCASEIVSAYVNKIPAICIACDDFMPMSGEERARLGELWTPEQRQAALSAHQLTLDMVVAAYAWLDGLQRVSLPRFGSLTEKGEAVAAAIELCKIRRHATVVGSGGKCPSILVLGAVSNAESLSTCEVVALALQFEQHTEAMVVRSAVEASAVARSAKHVVVILSHGVLDDEAFAASLLAVTRPPGSKEPVDIVTVLATGAAGDQGFAFPDGGYLSRLEADGLGGVPGKDIAAAYRQVLFILALPFSPLGSMGLIEKQLSEVARRFHKLRPAGSATSTRSRGRSWSSTSGGRSSSASASASDSSALPEALDSLSLDQVQVDEKQQQSEESDDGWVSERSL